jgi:hypothetical protein
VASSTHTHTVTSGSTDSALGTHSHGYSGTTGGPSATSTVVTGVSSASAGTPSGTISAIGTAQILGKALTSASVAGDSLTVLVCLAG